MMMTGMGMGFTRDGGVVFLRVCPELGLYPKLYVTVDIFTDVFGPQSGKRLAQ
jgi:hypothetical protein